MDLSFLLHIVIWLLFILLLSVLLLLKMNCTASDAGDVLLCQQFNTSKLVLHILYFPAPYREFKRFQALLFPASSHLYCSPYMARVLLKILLIAPRTAKIIGTITTFYIVNTCSTSKSNCQEFPNSVISYHKICCQICMLYLCSNIIFFLFAD